MSAISHEPLGFATTSLAPARTAWPPDRSIVVAAAKGDRRAMAELLTEAHPRVLSFLRGMGLRREAAEDVSADVAEAVVKGIFRLRDPVAFEAWFWSVARNQLRSWFRSQRRARRNEQVMMAPATPEDWAIERDDHGRIRQAMAALSLNDRQLLWLREVEGLAYEELATRFGSSAATIRVACHRARQRLQVAYNALD
ncbi:MAG: sigma-70 family RNA polymerase sigma factor [Actinobacteria bacterium]|nr:sigma-70 family RNA polymerase sigma factor [Actinomycetota bacterium]